MKKNQQIFWTLFIIVGYVVIGILISKGFTISEQR